MTESEETLDPVRQALEAGPRGVFQCLNAENRGTPGGHHLQVKTSLLYPGGLPINVHVRTDRSGYIVTDQGITSSIIKHLLPNVQNQKPGWEPMIRKICEGLDVGRAAMMLAQATLRMSITASMIRIINGG